MIKIESQRYILSIAAALLLPIFFKKDHIHKRAHSLMVTAHGYGTKRRPYSYIEE